MKGEYVPLPTPVQKLALGPGTINRPYTDLDLSSVIPAGSLAAVIGLRYRDPTLAAVVVDVRCKGVTSGGTSQDGTVFHGALVVTAYQYYNLIVPVGVDRTIQYKISNGGATTDFYIDVQGYFAGVAEMTVTAIRAIAGSPTNSSTDDHRAFPAIAASDSTVIAAWRQAGTHNTLADAATNGVIAYRRSIDTGATWTTVATISDSNYDLRDPALSLLPDGRFALSYFKYQAHSGPATINTDSDRCRGVFVKFSSDNGTTWGSEVPVTETPSMTALGPPGKAAKGRGSIQARANGDLVMAIYRVYITASSTLNWENVCYRSTDNGTTWTYWSTIQRDDSISGTEPELTILADGRWMCTSWNDTGDRVRRYLSSDKGATWGPASSLTVSGVNITGSSSGVVQTSDSRIVTLIRRPSSGGLQIHVTASADAVDMAVADSFRVSDGTSGYAAIAPTGNTNVWHIAFYKELADQFAGDIFIGLLAAGND